MPLKDYKVLKEKHPLTYEKQSEVYAQLFADLGACGLPPWPTMRSIPMRDLMTTL